VNERLHLFSPLEKWKNAVAASTGTRPQKRFSMGLSAQDENGVRGKW
jgi:hypothetical protein